MYIDNFYLNMNRKSKKYDNCNKYHTKCIEKNIKFHRTYKFLKKFQIYIKVD